MLLVQAGLATATAFQIRPLEGWGWFLFDAATSFFLGILILVKWPSSSVWAIGTLVGVAVLMGGISRAVVAVKDTKRRRQGRSRDPDSEAERAE